MKITGKKAKAWIIFLSILLAVAVIAAVFIIINKAGTHIVNEYEMSGEIIELYPHIIQGHNDDGQNQNYYMVIELADGTTCLYEEPLHRFSSFTIGDTVYAKSTVYLSGLGIRRVHCDYAFISFFEEN